MDVYSTIDWSMMPGERCFVRAMQAEDFPALERLVADIDHGVWTAREFSTSLSFGHRCWVLVEPEASQRLMGYLVMSVIQDEAELLMLGIARDFQGRGLGRCLLQHALDSLGPEVEAVYLEVRASNQKAQRLYAALGFYEVGVRRRYYRARGVLPAEDAVLMRLALESDSEVLEPS
jgi:ribosomal-protein-alanine N-acetyltransferase